MFVRVACLKCGKLFQVPESAIGTEVNCPYDNTPTMALPVAGMPAPSPEPLSLDDDLPQPAKAVPVAKPTRWIANAAIGLVLVVVVLAVTLALLRYGSGNIPPMAWSEFTPPDGSCSIELPGTPTEERIEPNASDVLTRGLNLYTTEGWYSRARVWFGWRDLDPGWAKLAEKDRDGSITSPVLSAERDRRKDQVQGTITKEATVRFDSHLGLEVWMDTPKGKLVERYVAATTGPRPRLYFFGIESKNASADGPAARRLFKSFDINKP